MKRILCVVFVLLPFALAAQTAAPESAPKTPPPPADAVFTAVLEGTPVSLNTDDGVTISGTFSPATEDQTKYVILLPDLGKNRSSYAKLSKSLKEAGIGFLAIDLRGHGKSVEQGHYLKFEKTGINNQFNKMYKDVNAAVNFLKEKRVKPQDIFILGSGLGANAAASDIVFNNDVGGAALITPSTNIRDVLTIPGVKISKIPLLIAAAPDVKKNFLEASLIRNVAFLAQGAGRVTFLTAYDKTGTEMIDAYLIPNIIAWIRNPALPPVREDGSVYLGADAPEIL